MRLCSEAEDASPSTGVLQLSGVDVRLFLTVWHWVSLVLVQVESPSVSGLDMVCSIVIELSFCWFSFMASLSIC